MQRPLACLVLMGALALAGCDNSSSPAPAPAPTSSTVSAEAVVQVTTETCDKLQAVAINSISFTDDDSQTDVSPLTPACTAH